jgi:hypothetical protein
MQDPLRAFLSSKRTSKRHALQLPVLINGPSLWISGESVDVSRNGVCIRVALGDLTKDVDDLAAQATSFDLVRVALDGGIKVLFPDSQVVAEAVPVRVTLDPNSVGYLQLGCRLNQNFSDQELRRLEMSGADFGPENPMYGLPSQALPIRMDSYETVRVELCRFWDKNDTICEGHVTALGQQALAVELDNQDDAYEVLRQLGCLELFFRAKRGAEVVWESRALMAALPMACAITGRVELGLVANQTPQGNLLKEIAEPDIHGGTAPVHAPWSG